jgi:hypothetical protein
LRGSIGSDGYQQKTKQIKQLKNLLENNIEASEFEILKD